MQECECGCGEIVAKRWKRGHNQRLRVDDPSRLYTVTESGCWEWNGDRHAYGYGFCDPRRFGVPEVGAPRKQGAWRALAHRVFYTVHHGPIPDGLVVRHKCDNPPCVNPDHLEVGTRADNQRDMVDRGRKRGGPRADFCKRGHDLNDPVNIRWSTVKKTGRRERRCKACEFERGELKSFP